jgi:hypothetical protein
MGLAAKSIIRNGDARAESHERDVEIAADGVVIARLVHGMRMRVGVPTRAYRGVVLSLDKTAQGADLFRVSLVHRDEDCSVLLEEATDDNDIVAIWRSWAAYFGLPKFIEREPGRLEGAERRLGQVALGASGGPRRRGALMNARRSRRRLLRRMGKGAEPARKPRAAS